MLKKQIHCLKHFKHQFVTQDVHFATPFKKNCHVVPHVHRIAQKRKYVFWTKYMAQTKHRDVKVLNSTRLSQQLPSFILVYYRTVSYKQKLTGVFSDEVKWKTKERKIISVTITHRKIQQPILYFVSIHLSVRNGRYELSLQSQCLHTVYIFHSLHWYILSPFRIEVNTQATGISKRAAKTAQNSSLSLIKKGIKFAPILNQKTAQNSSLSLILKRHKICPYP